MKASSFILSMMFPDIRGRAGIGAYCATLAKLSERLRRRTGLSGSTTPEGVPEHPLIGRSYFARYGNPGGRVDVHVSCHCTKREVLAAGRSVAKRLGGSGASVEERGELSEFHSLLMRAAVCAASADPYEVSDGFHWLLNAAGYNYVDEIALASGMSYSAAAAIHHDLPRIPKPWVFKNAPKGA